jgi:hypothetical protein
VGAVHGDTRWCVSVHARTHVCVWARVHVCMRRICVVEVEENLGWKHVESRAGGRWRRQGLWESPGCGDASAALARGAAHEGICGRPVSVLKRATPNVPASHRARAAPGPQVLLAALAATKHASERVREAAFALVRRLAQHQPGQFGPVLDVVVQPLLLGCADPSREVRRGRRGEPAGRQGGRGAAAAAVGGRGLGAVAGAGLRGGALAARGTAPLQYFVANMHLQILHVHWDTHTHTHTHTSGATLFAPQVLMAAHQALEALVDAMPPQRCLEALRFKLPTAEAVHRCACNGHPRPWSRAPGPARLWRHRLADRPTDTSA